MLKFNNAWRFDSPGEMPDKSVSDFFDFIVRIARHEQNTLEHFKRLFASVSGIPVGRSSSFDWALSDLRDHMDNASENAPLFIEAIYDGCEALRRNPDVVIPDLDYINRQLAKHETGYLINPPDLVFSGAQYVPTAPDIPISLDQKAQNTIQKSLELSRQFRQEGKYKQALLEILWLLETVSTAFDGMTTKDDLSVEGKYFNKIADNLKLQHQGKSLGVILGWIKNLHGYLSAPSGGGIRHGGHLTKGLEISQNEATLYCNLIESYIHFLLGEYERLKK